MDLSDNQIIERTLAGETEAFNTLVRRWENPIYGLSLRMLGRDEDARDVCQETFLAAFRNADFTELARLGSTGAAGIVLWPFRTLAALPLADSPRTFFSALPWALLLLVLNYVWILRTDVPFEEASAELSEKLEGLRRRGVRALRQPRASTRTPFQLAHHGRPEIAILWKNLISMGRMLSWATLVRIGVRRIFAGAVVGCPPELPRPRGGAPASESIGSPLRAMSPCRVADAGLRQIPRSSCD